MKAKKKKQDCRARRQAGSLLILYSLGFEKGCKCLYVCNLDFLIIIYWVWLPRRSLLLESFFLNVFSSSPNACVIDLLLYIIFGECLHVTYF
jgi:hypothetical protein